MVRSSVWHLLSPKKGVDAARGMLNLNCKYMWNDSPFWVHWVHEQLEWQLSFNDDQSSVDPRRRAHVPANLRFIINLIHVVSCPIWKIDEIINVCHTIRGKSTHFNGECESTSRFVTFFPANLDYEDDSDLYLWGSKLPINRMKTQL